MTLPMNRFHLTLGLAAAALTALGTIAAAQPTPDQQNSIRSNCRSDFMSKCSGVPRGGKEALECLRKNVAGLSPACKTAVSVTISAPAQAAPAAPPAPKPAAAAAVTPAAPPKAAVAKPAVATPSPPTVKPVAKPAVANAPPSKPANAAPSPSAVAAVPPPASPELGKLQTPFVPGSALIAKACARYLLMHCRDVEPGSGRAVACLNDYIKAGNFVGPRCQTALKLTAPLR